MKRIFWVLALGAVASAAMAVGLGRAADLKSVTPTHQDAAR